MSIELRLIMTVGLKLNVMVLNQLRMILNRLIKKQPFLEISKIIFPGWIGILMLGRKWDKPR